MALVLGGGGEGDVLLAAVSRFGSGAVSAGALGRDPAGWANLDPSTVDHPVREQGVNRAGDCVEKVDSFNYIIVALCARNFPSALGTFQRDVQALLRGLCA